MYEFDEVMADFANQHDLRFSRYADDLTFSSNDYLDKEEVILAVQSALETASYPHLKLNLQKTRLASKSTSRRVTGLVISNDGKVSLGRDRKRLISAMVHHAINGNSAPEAHSSLAGLLAFANDVEPDFIDRLRQKYGAAEVSALMK